MTTAQIEAKKNALTARIIKAAATGNQLRAEDLIEEIWELASDSGKDDLLIDLWDSKELTEEGVEFAIENNGCTDPRR